MKHHCNACTMELTPLARGFYCCPRCDTSAQMNGQRVGPPNMPGTRNGWFNAPFGDRK